MPDRIADALTQSGFVTDHLYPIYATLPSIPIGLHPESIEMAPLITHLVIGERVFAQMQYLNSTPLAYGHFLLGCVSVDVHSFLEDIDRRQTHFVGRPEENGEDAAYRSCDNFLSQLDDLLVLPWDDLTKAEQAFATGYLCHLAADEPWKEAGWKLLQMERAASWTDFPVPGMVILTAFSVQSSRMFVDFPAVASALSDISVPDVFTHVPHTAFQRMWDLVQEYVLGDGTAESYFELLEREGRPHTEIEAIRRLHIEYWEKATALISDDIGGIEQYLEGAVKHCVQVLPRLWAKARPRLNNQ